MCCTCLSELIYLILTVLSLIHYAGCNTKSQVVIVKHSIKSSEIRIYAVNNQLSTLKCRKCLNVQCAIRTVPYLQSQPS